MSLEFTLHADGSCSLSEDGELVWSSDDDDEFLEEFDATIDPEEIDEVVEWLEDNDYLSEDDALDIVYEDDSSGIAAKGGDSWLH